MFKKIISVFLVLMIFLTAVITVHADTPYITYEKSKWFNDLVSPDLFVPVRQIIASQTGTHDFSSPEEFCFDKDGNVYVADSGNKRIAVFDNNFKFLYEIKYLKFDDGSSDDLKNPTDVFVTDSGDIYIADPKAARVVAVDKNGNVKHQYTKPRDEIFTASSFQPTKVVVDKTNMVYVVCTNVFQGILLFNNDGEFMGYYGSPTVSVSLQLLMDRFWKGIMSKEQRSVMSNYVPVEYSDIYVNNDGFVYASIRYTESYKEQIRKLNYLGNNILPYKLNFGEDEIIDYKRDKWFTKFVSVAVEDEFIYALDSQWQRVYVFDSNGQRLGVFGTNASQLGGFLNPASVKVFNKRVYVLDKTKSSITEFQSTEYGELILNAVSIYNKGDYEKAVSIWEKVSAMNVNNQLAYTGIGEAKLMNGEYKEAVKYFRLADNQQRESVSFYHYRSEIMRKYIVIIVVLILLMAILAMLLTNRAFLNTIKRYKPGKGIVRNDTLKVIVSVLRRPVEAFNELKFKRYSNTSLVIVILLIWLILNIAKRELYGFRFNNNNPKEFSLLIQLSLTIIPFVLFTVSNWSVCAIMDGEGKYKEIVTYTAISMIPYILFLGLSIPLSNILTLSEGMFLSAFNAVGILWTLMLLFQSQRIVHNYSSLKTIGAAFLTICGVAIILIIALLFFSLVQQVNAFVESIYSEIVFRK